ncbi:unnamed protein product [Effrenium voratum]|nr:unnamed protein product [Effrenium voratum]
MADAPKEELKSKKTFVAACGQLAKICEDEEAAKGLEEEGKTAFTVLQTRFSNPKFWQAGLELFLALEFAGVAPAAKWRDAALEASDGSIQRRAEGPTEVDEEARERAKQQAQQRKLEEDRKHNKGRFGDAVTPLSLGEMLASQGMVLLNEDSRPGMSRDAQHELRVKTVMEEDICVVCQEAMPLGSKAKAMPCGHLFHDDCLLSWVQKSNSCPTCRFDELPSEKRHFDDVQRQVMQRQPDLYS